VHHTIPKVGFYENQHDQIEDEYHGKYDGIFQCTSFVGKVHKHVNDEPSLENSKENKRNISGHTRRYDEIQYDVQYRNNRQEYERFPKGTGAVVFCFRYVGNWIVLAAII
jgi:hypothetical protein